MIDGLLIILLSPLPLFSVLLSTKERKRKRQHYIPVAADPSLYSLTQVANFLRAR